MPQKQPHRGRGVRRRRSHRWVEIVTPSSWPMARSTALPSRGLRRGSPLSTKALRVVARQPDGDTYRIVIGYVEFRLRAKRPLVWRVACGVGSDWPGGPVSGTGAGYGGRPKTSAPTLRPPRGVPLGQASLTVSRAVSSPCREPRLQPAVISFDDVVGVLLGHLSGRRDELVEHTRVDGSPVGAHLDRRRSSRQRASEELPCRGQPPSKCNSASLPIYQPTTLTFSAWGLFWPCVMSNSTFCPSSMLR
jgi:hypothetical protein